MWPVLKMPFFLTWTCCGQASHRLCWPRPNLWNSSRGTVAESVPVCLEDLLEDQAEFLIIPRHQELLGDRARDCDISVSIEKTGLEGRGQCTLSYVLFRCVWKPVCMCFSGMLSLGRYFPGRAAGRCWSLYQGHMCEGRDKLPAAGAFGHLLSCLRVPHIALKVSWHLCWQQDTFQVLCRGFGTLKPPLPSPVRSLTDPAATTTPLFLSCDIFNSCIFIVQATDSGFLPRMQRGRDWAPLPATAPALHQSVLQYQMQ